MVSFLLGEMSRKPFPTIFGKRTHSSRDRPPFGGRDGYSGNENAISDKDSCEYRRRAFPTLLSLFSEFRRNMFRNRDSDIFSSCLLLLFRKRRSKLFGIAECGIESEVGLGVVKSSVLEDNGSVA